jgi:hypothetical protein
MKPDLEDNSTKSKYNRNIQTKAEASAESSSQLRGTKKSSFSLLPKEPQKSKGPG